MFMYSVGLILYLKNNTRQQILIALEWWFNCFVLFSALVERMMSGEVTDGPSMQALRDALINVRQHEAFLRIILVS